MKIETRSFGGFTGQGPLLMAQRNMFSPTESPVMVLVALLMLVIVPVPEIRVQVPWAGAVGAFAAMVAVVVGRQ